MHAELVYLFRHALLRSAAYELQLPGDRARLHVLALELLEQLFGGRPEAASLPAPCEARRPGLRVSRASGSFRVAWRSSTLTMPCERPALPSGFSCRQRHRCKPETERFGTHT